MSAIKHLLLGFALSVTLLATLAAIAFCGYWVVMLLRELWFALANISAWCSLGFVLCLASAVLAALGKIAG